MWRPDVSLRIPNQLRKRIPVTFAKQCGSSILVNLLPDTLPPPYTPLRRTRLGPGIWVPFSRQLWVKWGDYATGNFTSGYVTAPCGWCRCAEISNKGHRQKRSDDDAANQQTINTTRKNGPNDRSEDEPQILCSDLQTEHYDDVDEQKMPYAREPFFEAEQPKNTDCRARRLTEDRYVKSTRKRYLHSI